MQMEELLKKQNIAIWGYGLEGKSAVDLLIKNKYNGKITVIDNRDITENINNVVFIKENDIEKYNFDLIIKSAGVSIYKDIIQKLIQQGTEITSILNIFLAKVQQYPVKTIAITGTKGKSTTSSILYHILKGCGYKVALLGNIGISVLDMYDDIDKYDYFVLEVSSYQATTIKYMVDYGIVLNLFKEHIQWHLTHDNYYRDKLNLLKYSKIKIVNGDNETIKKLVDLNNGDYICFPQKNSFFVENNNFYFGNQKIFSLDEISNINGEHIFKNICSIFNVLKNENIPLNKAVELLKTFEPLKHRLEIFYKDTDKNIAYIDDSISTIPEATCECIKTFSKTYKNIFLILGGFDRQQDYKILVDLIKEYKDKIKIYLVGETGKRLKEILTDSKYFDNYESLTAEIKQDISNRQNDYAVILSPASPSYDMFKNFEERGDEFKRLMINK